MRPLHRTLPVLMDKKHDILSIALLIFLGISLFNFAYTVGKVPFEERFIDFGGNCAYSLYLRTHPASLYDWQAVEAFRATLSFPYSHIRALYPLPFYLVLTPLALIDYRVSSFGWFTGSILLYAFSLYLLLRLVGWQRSLLKTALAVAVAVNYYPFIFNLELGQTEALVLFLLVASLYAAQRRRQGLAGVLLGAVSCVKVIPAFLILFMLWKRKFKAALCALLTIVFMHGASVWAYGADVHRQWLEFLLTKGVSLHFPNEANLSLFALFHRLLTRNALTVALAHLPLAADLLTHGSTLAIAAIFFWKCRRPVDEGSPRFTAEYAWAVLTMLLLSGLVESHHFTWLMPGILTALYILVTSPTPPKAVLFIVSYLLMGMKYFPDGIPLSKQGVFTLLLNAKLFGVFGLWFFFHRYGDCSGQQEG